MPRTRNKLTVKQVFALGPGMHGDGGGLWLRVLDSGSRNWVYRFRLHGRARQMGLGGADRISLVEARNRRNTFEAMVANGIDPVEARRIEQEEAKANADQITLAEVAHIAYDAHKARLKGDGKAGRWFSPVRLHILPKLGARPIVSIDQNDVKLALEPIWHSKAPTASKAADRLNIIMKHGVALGYDVDIQAVTKARILLGRQRHSVSNIESMPWKDVPSFYSSLNKATPTQLALRLLILNPGARSAPIRFLRPDEHIEDGVWNVPSELMKGPVGKDNSWRTKLGPESLCVIEQAQSLLKSGYLFPNKSGRGVISDASMARLMERRNLAFRPHGFRASFKTWATETRKPRDLTELCLAHKVYGVVEASYLRTDLIDERAALMREWENYVCGF